LREFLEILFMLPSLLKVTWFLIALVLAGQLAAQERAPLQNVNDLPADLTIPELQAETTPPAAGKRVKQRNPGYESWELHHVLYLPTDWRPEQRYPVLVELPGNGNYSNAFGDRSLGRPEDCKLGYGISGGEKFIWVSLPFLDRETHRHAIEWWGDADATSAYCRETVDRVCKEFGGDADAVILCGFSRGAIACGYIGLRDADTAKLWRAMIMHSHYDGVRTWKYADSDAASARSRWSRFQGKPQFVSQERSVANIEQFLKGSDTRHITLLALPMVNHTDEWVLKDLPERKQLRAWLSNVLQPQPAKQP
jgi:acetyl esterase/lipase